MTLTITPTLNLVATIQTVAPGTISSSTLVDGAVSTPKIADDAVTAAKIAAGAVGTSEIADGSVTNAKIAAGLAASKVAVSPIAGLVAADVQAALAEINATTGTLLPLTGGDLTGQTRLAAGSAAAPALSRTGDTNTGLYFPAADSVAFSTGGTARWVIDSAGRVGVGTPTPVSPLHVIGLIINQIGSPGILYAGGDLSMGLNFNIGTDGSAAYIGTGSAHPVRVLVNNAEAVRISTSGQIGIGTASPSAPLHVIGLILNQIGSPGLIFAGGDLSMGLNFNIGTDGSAAYIGTGSAHPVRILANNAEVARITTTGRVGIATASPTTALHVSGPIRVGAFTVGTLPAAGTVGAGTIAWATDANATTRQAIVAGGGANTLLVYSDGTNWRIV